MLLSFNSDVKIDIVPLTEHKHQDDDVADNPGGDTGGAAHSGEHSRQTA